MKMSHNQTKYTNLGLRWIFMLIAVVIYTVSTCIEIEHKVEASGLKDSVIMADRK